MSDNWDSNVLDDLEKTTNNSYQKHLNGIVYYSIACIVFIALPLIIMELFSPQEFAKLMHYAHRDYSIWTVFSMFGVAAVFGLIVLVKLFLYFKNKAKQY